MQTIEQELLSITIEGLANTKSRVDLLESSVSTTEKSLADVKEEYLANRGLIQESINKSRTENEKDLQEAIENLPIPKDGIEGKPGKDGVDGKNGESGPVGKDGKEGRAGVPGKDGKNGKDGRSVSMVDVESLLKKEVNALSKKDKPKVQDVNLIAGKLVLTYCNGKSKSILLPKEENNVGPLAVFAAGSPTIGSDITSVTVKNWLASFGIAITRFGIEVSKPEVSLVLRDSNDKRWKLTVTTEGLLSTESVGV